MVTLSIRPLVEADIPSLVNYWFGHSDENLIRMGVDKSKLVSRTKFHESLKLICHLPSEETSSCCMIWLVNNEPVGHNALKDIVKNEIANIHLHMWNSENRKKGYGAKLFCMATLEFFKKFNLKTILCEPSFLNPAPNQMLNKIGFKKWKTYSGATSDLSLIGKLNSYIISPEIAKNFLNQ